MTSMASRLRVRVLAIASLVLVTACAHGPTVTPGRYESGDGAESVTIEGSAGRFHVRVGPPGRETIVTREYEFSVGQDGRIQAHPLRSVEAAFGVGRYDWWWDGEKIVREDPRTGSVELFVREGEGSP
jgi:hypothetical protein